MTLIVKGTARWADPFVRSYRRAITLPRIPDSFDELSRAQRTAKLLCLRSQYEHMELITEGKTLPVVLAANGAGSRAAGRAATLRASTRARPSKSRARSS